MIYNLTEENIAEERIESKAGRKTTPSKITPDIEPKGTIKVSKTGSAHIPRELMRELETDRDQEIPWIPNANIAVLYNPNISLDKFIAGLEILKAEAMARFTGKSEDEIVALIRQLRVFLDSGRVDKAKELLDQLSNERRERK